MFLVVLKVRGIELVDAARKYNARSKKVINAAWNENQRGKENTNA